MGSLPREKVRHELGDLLHHGLSWAAGAQPASPWSAPQAAGCFGLAWLDARCPPKPLYHSPSSTGQGRGNTMTGSRVKIKTRRDHSPITVMDQTD